MERKGGVFSIRSVVCFVTRSLENIFHFFVLMVVSYLLNLLNKLLANHFLRNLLKD